MRVEFSHPGQIFIHRRVFFILRCILILMCPIINWNCCLLLSIKTEYFRRTNHKTIFYRKVSKILAVFFACFQTYQKYPENTVQFRQSDDCFNLLTTERILWYINVVKPSHFPNCVLDIVTFRILHLKLDKGESLISVLLCLAQLDWIWPKHAKGCFF